MELFNTFRLVLWNSSMRPVMITKDIPEIIRPTTTSVSWKSLLPVKVSYWLGEDISWYQTAPRHKRTLVKAAPQMRRWDLLNLLPEGQSNMDSHRCRVDSRWESSKQKIVWNLENSSWSELFWRWCKKGNKNYNNFETVYTWKITFALLNCIK